MQSGSVPYRAPRIPHRTAPERRLAATVPTGSVWISAGVSFQVGVITRVDDLCGHYIYRPCC